MDRTAAGSPRLTRVVPRDEVGRRSKYLTRRIRRDPQFLVLARELDEWFETSPEAQHMAMRWTVRLYDDALHARIRQGERIRDILQRSVASDRVLSAVGDIDAALKASRSGNSVIPVPLFGAMYTAASLEESRAAALVELAVAHHPAWPWLNGISGIGPLLAGRLLSRLDIHRAPSPASFWSYCGLATVAGAEYRCHVCGQHISAPVGMRDTPLHRRADGRPCVTTTADPLVGSDVRVAQPRARRGERRSYDAAAKHACYLIGVSFVRRGITYKAIYTKQLQLITDQHPEWPLKRVQLAAQRATVKGFLADLWVEWQRVEQLAHSRRSRRRTRTESPSAGGNA